MYLLDIADSHPPVEDPDAPALITGAGGDTYTCPECDRCVSLFVVVLVHCQSASCLVLHQDVTFSIAIPISEMDPNTRTWDVQGYFDIVVPSWWRTDVDIEFSGMAVLIDPHEVIAALVEHVAIEVPIGLELGSSAALVLPDHHIVVIICLFQVDVVSATRTEDTAKLDAVLYAGRFLAGVRLAGRSPCGKLSIVSDCLGSPHAECNILCHCPRLYY